MDLPVPLVAVNCLILHRAEHFAVRNGIGSALADGLGMGLGYVLAMTLVGCVRELLGRGTLFGTRILAEGPLLLAVLPAGGFLCLGLLMGLCAMAGRKSHDKEGTQA